MNFTGPCVNSEQQGVNYTSQALPNCWWLAGGCRSAVTWHPALWDVIFIPTHVFRDCIKRGALQPLIYLFCSSEGTRLAHAPEDTRGSQQGPRSQYISSKGKITEQWILSTRVFVLKGCCTHAQRGRFAKIYKTVVFFGLKFFTTEPSIHLLSRGCYPGLKHPL